MQELELPKPIFEYNTIFATILLDKTEGKGVEEVPGKSQKNPRK